MKFLTYNVAHQTRESNKNLPGMAGALASLSPDIIVLTEYVQGLQHDRFVADLKDLDFPYTLVSQKTPGENQVLVASRTPLKQGSITPPLVRDAPSVPSNMLHVCVPDRGCEVLGLRIPAFDDAATIRKEKRNAYWDWILRTAQEKMDRPFVIMGDFNTDPAYANADGGVRFTQLEKLSYIHALPKDGDSWWGKSVGGEYAKRLDHVILSRHFTVKDAQYRTESEEYFFARNPEAMSDHAALLVEAELK
jgi:endonuclease/exonuclease/phosphatase family metal-dependent hydrolase